MVETTNQSPNIAWSFNSVPLGPCCCSWTKLDWFQP